MKIIHKATKKPDGTFSPLTDTEKILFNSQVKFIPDGVVCKIEISIYDAKKEEKELRTIAQNRYYHKLLDIICDHTGDTHMDMHDKLKVKFLARPYIMDGTEYRIVKSTTELTPQVFSDYLEKIFHWASEELEMVLPTASDYY